MAPLASRRALLAAGAAWLAPVAGCTAPRTPTTITVDEGFEAGLAGWDRAADVPTDPATGEPVGWAIEPAARPARSGSAGLRFTLDGSQDDGTIWVHRPIDVVPGVADDISLRTWAWSASESFNTLAHLVLRLAPTRPSVEGDFPPPGRTWTGDGGPAGGLRQPLNRRAGWDEYAVEWSTAALAVERLWLAVGIAVVWETTVTYGVDDLSLTMTPR